MTAKTLLTILHAMFRGKQLADLAQQYRRSGYLFISSVDRTSGLFNDNVLGDLQRACCDTIAQRGAMQVPKQDDHNKQRMETKSSIVPPPPGDAAAATSGYSSAAATVGGDYRVEAGAKLKKKTIRMKLKLRNQEEVDKAYDQVTAARKLAAKEGSAGASLSTTLDAAEKKLERGEISEAEVMKSFDAKAASETFQAYQASGRLDSDIRKQNHLDDVYRYVENTVQSWNRTWPSSPGLQALLLGRRREKKNGKEDTSLSSSLSSPQEGSTRGNAPLGDPLGELCGYLAGSMVARLYDDSILRLPMLSNSLPVHFHGAFTSFRDPRGLDALIALPYQTTKHSPASVVVYPGSHHVLADLTSKGEDIAQFQKTSLWDIGDAVRPYGVLTRSAQPVMLKMEPGSVLIANNLLLRSCMPTMDGVIDASTSWASPAQLGDPANRGLVDLCPLLYMVQFMPDGATFDGARDRIMCLQISPLKEKTLHNSKRRRYGTSGTL
ncbi:Hypothetical protein, putative [Bodo saltans]|uniref:Uncharacterized protein n=1 Tax=Bodo saltans TaxID=75058 RepID=A0A0S4JBB6_BODSA|nr:Hypothetical protein, putative [Bodo saltans]|eukprot:CUG88777.1 Hypothetical protein, putative [Bodo saltans]